MMWSADAGAPWAEGLRGCAAAAPLEALSRGMVTLSAGATEDERAELSAPLPRCPAAPPAGGRFMKIAGTIAMVIISRIAQMVRPSMDSGHVVRGQGRTRPGE